MSNKYDDMTTAAIAEEITFAGAGALSRAARDRLLALDGENAKLRAELHRIQEAVTSVCEWGTTEPDYSDDYQSGRSLACWEKGQEELAAAVVAALAPSPTAAGKPEPAPLGTPDPRTPGNERPIQPRKSDPCPEATAFFDRHIYPHIHGEGWVIGQLYVVAALTRLIQRSPTAAGEGGEVQP